MSIQNAINLKDAGIAYHDGNGVFSGNNLRAATNIISSTNTNGDVILSPNGTGGVVAVTDLTVGNSTQDVDFTVNGTAISATVSVEGVNSTDLGGIISHRHSDTAGFGGHFVNLRSRGSHASPTVVSADDTLSIYATAGYDGTDYAQAAQIITAVDGTPGSNDMPGRMVFLTSADGAQVPTEAMRITSGQLVGINTSAPNDTLHVTGNMELDHTAAENDDHAIEIVCNANGFADVKALDIDYITGTLAAAQDEEAILVNIDESASTGGIMAGYLVLTTSEGSATVNGYETGININPVVQQTGTFGDADSILNKAVDVTAALASGGAGAISIFVADNDTLTIGDAAQWGELEIILSTGASGSGVAPTFEYSTGGAAFSAFSPADGTNGFRNSGAILWDSSTLTGWATATSGLYEVRITRTRNSLSTNPIIDEIQIAALTEYKWDKDGNVNLNSLALATPLTVNNGGTGKTTLTPVNGLVIANGTSAVGTTNAATDGQILIGKTLAAPAFADLISTDSSITITAGANTLDVEVTGAGDFVSGPASATDNALARFDGTTGKLIQNSVGILTDAGAMSGLTLLDVDNIRIDGNTISSTDTNGSISIVPDGTGNILTTADRVWQDYSSNAGTVDARVYNSDSTASAVSSAEIQVMSRPEPDGEARFVAAIAATRGYALGVDDGDSGVFKITTAASSAPTLSGSTEIWRMTTAGERTMPLQPAFLAYLASDDLNVTGNATLYTIGTNTALTERYDQNGDFNTNGTFTAPVTGRYNLTAQVTMVATSMGGSNIYYIQIVTSNFTYAFSQQKSAAIEAFKTNHMSVLADMDAGDTAVIKMAVTAIGADTADVDGSTNGITFFSGNLAC
jgi:hypothetical protein